MNVFESGGIVAKKKLDSTLFEAGGVFTSNR